MAATQDRGDLAHIHSGIFGLSVVFRALNVVKESVTSLHCPYDLFLCRNARKKCSSPNSGLIEKCKEERRTSNG